jgi:hypothetical protein
MSDEKSENYDANNTLVIQSSFFSWSFILFFLTGFFGLSGLSNQITAQIGMPYLIELFFVPLFLAYRKKITEFRNQDAEIKQRFSLAFFLLMIVLFLSTLIGILNTGDAYNVLTCIRPFIYLCLIAYICSKKTWTIDLYCIYYIVFGTLAGEFANKGLLMTSFAAIDHINTQALAVFIIIPFIKRNNILIVFSTLVGLSMAILTMYRRELIVCLCAVCVGMIYVFSKQKLVRLIASVATFAALGSILFKFYKEILGLFISLFRLDNVQYFYLSGTYRMIEKFEQQDNASDAYRITLLEQIATKFREQLLPSGAIGKSVGITHFGAYTDAPFIFLYDIFGSVLAWIIVLYLGYLACRCVLNVFLKGVSDEEYILCALMVPIFLISLIMDGTFLVHANISLIAGYSMHGWFKKGVKINENFIH